MAAIPQWPVFIFQHHLTQKDTFPWREDNWAAGAAEQ